MAEDRIAQLSKRFRTHAVGRKSSTSRTRERHSFYLDVELTGQLGRAYKELNHTLYPRTVSKSAFLETLIEYGLDNLSDIQATLSQAESTDESAAS